MRGRTLAGVYNLGLGPGLSASAGGARLTVTVDAHGDDARVDLCVVHRLNGRQSLLRRLEAHRAKPPDDKGAHYTYFRQ